nr:integrase, catalytic region, zinc finger, CCHC-type, peptidase aspartic, catalytic [Tanacetum cinerariifolium]
MNQVLIKNERLLKQIINKDIVNIVMNSSMDNDSMNMHECKKCLELETELLNKKDFIEKETYDKLFKSYTTLEKHCIPLEVDTQLNQEIFQRDNSTYKQLYDSIKPTRVRSKEQSDALINQVNLKSVEISDLNANLQKQGLIIAALRDELRKLKEKSIVDNAVRTHIINPKMFKVDVEPIASNLLNNRTIHFDYRRITTTAKVPLRKPTTLETDTPMPVITLVYSRKPRKSKINVHVSKPTIIKSKSANKEPSKSWGSIVSNVPSSSLDECRSPKLFSGNVKFRNDHVAKIMGYGDYQIGNVMILRVYYVEGLGHNLFSVGQFCDLNLEVAFRQHTYFICNLEGVDLLTGSQGNNLYILSLGDMMASYPICILLKASKTKSWLWHQCLSHLNFALEVIAPIAKVVALAPAASTGLPSLINVDQDVPSPSNSQTTPKTQSPVLFNDVEEENHDLDVAHMNNDSFFGVEESPKTLTFNDDPLHESLHVDSTSQGSSSNMRQTHTSFESLGWTKDHPILNVIDDPSRSVSTIKQLQTDAMWCFFDAFLTLVEPKNFKQAMTEPSWIDAMMIHFMNLFMKTQLLKDHHRI